MRFNECSIIDHHKTLGSLYDENLNRDFIGIFVKRCTRIAAFTPQSRTLPLFYFVYQPLYGRTNNLHRHLCLFFLGNPSFAPSPWTRFVPLSRLSSIPPFHRRQNRESGNGIARKIASDCINSRLWSQQSTICLLN